MEHACGPGNSQLHGTQHSVLRVIWITHRPNDPAAKLMAKLIAKLTNTAKHFKREPDIISQPANIVAMVQ